MNNEKKKSRSFYAALILSVLLIVAVFLLLPGLRTLWSETALELSLTPTPLPPYGNVMQVTPDPNAAPAFPILRNGSAGEDVKTLQARLRDLGYYTGEIDGQFGSGTRSAVTAFQSRNRLQADGVVGQETAELLYSAAALPALPPSGDIPAEMPLLVNRDHPISDADLPKDLVCMNSYCDSSIVRIKHADTYGEREAVDALMTMLRAAHADGITVWQISAAYRSKAEQQRLYSQQYQEYLDQGMTSANAASAASKNVADPGTSEHHTGLAFDITVPDKYFVDTKQCAWIREHCAEYGFVMRYASDKERITGFVQEVWHYRYVGVEHAQHMTAENLCLEEYIEKYGR